MKKFALAGNPNCGKTTLFNSLTGSTAHVGNWPGVTVDKKEGVYKKCAEPVSIVDLPGVYSLSPYTPEEIITRNYILDEKPDCVINIVDATNLERNLYLTTQIMEIDVPTVVALNMMDEVEKSGNKIDAEELEKKIGLPVVKISALRGKGLDELMERAYKASQSKREGVTVMEGTALMHLIGDCKIALEGQNVENALFHAIKLTELDELEVKAHPNAAKTVEEFKKTFADDVFGNDFEAIVADSRYKYITAHYSGVLTKKPVTQTADKTVKKGKKERPVSNEQITRSDKIDKVLTHRVWGIPIFLVILFLIFHLTFSEDLLFLGAGGVFDKEVFAYNAAGEKIEAFYDADGNELDKIADSEGNILSLYDKDGNEYTVFYDEDGNEVVPVADDDGMLGELETVPYAYDKEGNAIKSFYDKDGAEITVLADENGELLDLYNDKGEKYEEFFNADGYKMNLVLYDDGEFEDVEFASGIDEFCSEVTVNTFFGYEEGVYSPGVILQSALTTLTDFISACVAEGLADAAPWVSGLIVDGIFAGLFSILSFLPQILLLFLFFSILEDSGYMARVAFILDRIFRKFGLSGRAFMPMIMGFGCSVPAMINTRTLADRNERTATIRVIPFFSCGAKLPILTAIAGGIVSWFGIGNADLITYGMYLLGIVVALASVILMRNTSMKGEVPPFIMELPAYHAPQFKNLMLHLWDKTKHFIKKAFTIILASTIVIWFVSHFSWNWNFLPDERMNESILAGLGGLIRPLFTPLGFGSQLTEYGWVFVVAAITGLIAKENVVATFGTLAACITNGFVANEALEGVDSVVQMISATGITVPALIAFIAFNMITIPCLAAVATAKAELPDKKTFNFTLLFWIAASYIVATMVYVIGSRWWTVFIFAAVWAAVIALIILTNKGKIDWSIFKKFRKAKK